MKTFHADISCCADTRLWYTWISPFGWICLRSVLEATWILNYHKISYCSRELADLKVCMHQHALKLFSLKASKNLFSSYRFKQGVLHFVLNECRLDHSFLCSLFADRFHYFFFVSSLILNFIFTSNILLLVV